VEMSGRTKTRNRKKIYLTRLYSLARLLNCSVPAKAAPRAEIVPVRQKEIVVGSEIRNAKGDGRKRANDPSLSFGDVNNAGY